MSDYRNELEMEQTALVTAGAAALNELDQKIEGLRIGGRNYVQSKDFTEVSIYHEVTLDGAETFRGQDVWKVIHHTGAQPTNTTGYILIRKGESVTLSVFCKQETLGDRLRLLLYSSSLGQLADSYSENVIGQWKRAEAKWTNDTGSDQRAMFNIYDNTLSAGAVARFSCPKFEFGNKATDWVPAIENLATAAQGALAGTALQPGALSGYALESWVSSNFDWYKNWRLWTNGSQKTSVNSGQKVDLKEGNNINISYSAGGVVTFSVTGLGIADVANLANALAGKKDDFSVLPVAEGGTGESSLEDLKEETALIAKAQTSGLVRITTGGSYLVKKTDHTIIHIVSSGLSELQLDAVEIHGFQINLQAGSNNLTLNKDLYNPGGGVGFSAGTNIGGNIWELVFDKPTQNWYYLGT